MQLIGDDKKPVIDYAKITPEIFRTSVSQLKADYAELQRIAKLKGTERRTQAAKFEAEIQRLKKSPKAGDIERLLSAAVLPGLTRLLERDETGEMRRALFAMAIAVQKDGPESFDKLPQPSGGKVEYKKIDGGFELRGKLLESDRVEVLRIGPPEKK